MSKPLTEPMDIPTPGPLGAAFARLRCRLGAHAWVMDGAPCCGSQRCRHCLTWERPAKGVLVAVCRAYTAAYGPHEPLRCRQSMDARR